MTMKTTIASALVAAALAMLPSWATAQQITNEQCNQHFIEYRNGYRAATDALNKAETELEKQQTRQDQEKYKRLFAQFFNLSMQAGCMVNLILTAYPQEAQEALRTQLF